jgi:ferredoxin
MEVVIPPLFEEKCGSCGKCVQVCSRNDALDFNAPYIRTECPRSDCPIKAKHEPGPIEIVEIYFVDC